MIGNPVELPAAEFSINIGGSKPVEDLTDILAEFDAKLYKSEISEMLKNTRELDDELFPIKKPTPSLQ